MKGRIISFIITLIEWRVNILKSNNCINTLILFQSELISHEIRYTLKEKIIEQLFKVFY